jgi:hypothetical protein
MTSEPLPSHLPWYCMSCGASLIYTEISTVDGEGSASWKCSGCGKEDTDEWSEFHFTPIDQTDQSALESDIEFKPPSPDYPFMLPPPPPPPPPLSGGLAIPPTPSYFDIPEDARIVQEQFEREFKEHHKQYEALRRRIEADGVVAIVRAAHFPLFALNGFQGRFPFLSHGWGGSGWSPGETPRMLSSFSLTYTGPSYPNVTERIDIKQEDKESSPWLNLITDELHAFDADCIVRLLAGLPGGDEPDMHALWEGMAIYQYVNLETTRRAPVVRASIQLQSGEVASWVIRRFNAPLSLAHARAQIEDTIIDVGAIGRAAEEIENLLGQMTRLTPDSDVLDQIDRGLKAWKEYFQRGFQS